MSLLPSYQDALALPSPQVAEANLASLKQQLAAEEPAPVPSAVPGIGLLWVVHVPIMLEPSQQVLLTLQVRAGTLFPGMPRKPWEIFDFGDLILWRCSRSLLSTKSNLRPQRFQAPRGSLPPQRTSDPSILSTPRSPVRTRSPRQPAGAGPTLRGRAARTLEGSCSRTEERPPRRR